MGHHHHPGAPVRVAVRTQRLLLAAVVPFLVATIVALVVLWPDADPLQDSRAGPAPTLYGATVTAVNETPCVEGAGAPGTDFVCAEVSAELAEGPDEGDEITFQFARGEGSRPFRVGDDIQMTRSPDADPELRYQFFDYERTLPLAALAVIFGLFVVALSRWRGLSALLGLGMSIFLLVRFVLPAILEGKSPLLIAIVGSAAIMFIALYLAHGVNARTTTAVLGILVSLVVTGLLGAFFVEASRFTGLGSEEAAFLQLSAGEINLQGLLLGGIVIGALGVLDDVTVTQASAVWELHAANPVLGFKGLYSSALRIGRDHITSTVNTLVLAYAGASLPLLILFTISNRTIASVVTSEVVADEIVRTLVGSIGLVASVPITTMLAALVVTSAARTTAAQAE